MAAEAAAAAAAAAGGRGGAEHPPKGPLASFLPAMLDVDYVPALGSRGETLPVVQQVFGSCMFVDISNFSLVSNKMCAESVRGPERIAFFLNSCFAQVARLVAKAGGDILKFAGDAIIAAWPVDGGAEGHSPSLAVAVQRCVQCAIDVQETLPTVDISEDLQWSFKIGIGAGSLAILHLGGCERFPRREFLAVGDALMQAFEAELLAQPKGQVICSPTAIALVGHMFECAALRGGFVKVLRQTVFVKKKSLVTLNRLAQQRDADARWRQRASVYIPEALLSCAEDTALQDGRDWVSELRHITVLFVHLGFSSVAFEGGTPEEAARSAERLNMGVCLVQRAVYDYEGDVNKLSMDEKGITAIAVFGLAPRAHENDATRGVLAALRIVSDLERELGLEPSAGLTTDLCFCGVVGHVAGRREYTVIGDAVNMAARLMQSAKSRKAIRVFVDERTRSLVHSEVCFELLHPDISVKGKTSAIPVFCPSHLGRASAQQRLSLAAADAARFSSLAPNAASPVDWRTEWEQQVSRYGARIQETVRDFRLKLVHAEAVEQGPQRLTRRLLEGSETVIALCGSTGSGKTYSLAALWKRLVGHSDTIVLCAAGNPFERGALERRFGVWVDMIEQRLVVATTTTLGLSRQACLLQWLRMAGAHDSRPFFLLNNLFEGVHFLGSGGSSRRGFGQPTGAAEPSPDTVQGASRLSYQPSGRGPLDCLGGVDSDWVTAALLVTLLRGIVISTRNKRSRVVCLVDDALFSDPGSWLVVRYVAEEAPDFLRVVLTIAPARRGHGPQLHGHAVLESLGELVAHEEVPPLSYGELGTLVRGHLDVLSAPEELVDLVALASRGNPLFAEEILTAMLEAGLLSVDASSRVCLWNDAAKRERWLALLPREALSEARETSKAAPARVSMRLSQSSTRRLECLLLDKYARYRRFDAKRLEGEHAERSMVVMAALRLEPPVSLCCVLASWLNGLQLRKLLLLKTAAVALLLDVEHPQYRLRRGWVEDAFSLLEGDLSRGDSKAEVEALIDDGLLKNDTSDIQAELGDLDRAPGPEQISFVHWLMPRVLRLRTLCPQREEIVRRLEQAQERYDMELRRAFLSKAAKTLNASQPLKTGPVLVQKSHLARSGPRGKWARRRNSLGTSWKRRYACLFTDRLELYTDDSGGARKGCIYLDGASVQIDTLGGDTTPGSRLSMPKVGARGQVLLLRLDARRWSKNGKEEVLDGPPLRSFYLRPAKESREVLNDWTYKIRLAIESAEGPGQPSPARSAAMANAFTADGKVAVGGASATAPSSPLPLPLPPPPPVPPPTPGAAGNTEPTGEEAEEDGDPVALPAPPARPARPGHRRRHSELATAFAGAIKRSPML